MGKPLNIEDFGDANIRDNSITLAIAEAILVKAKGLMV